MPYTEYYQKNKEKQREYQKKYIENNPERKRIKTQNNKKWRESEKGKQYKNHYNTTEKGKKTQLIASWKHQGLIDNYEMVYERYYMAIFCDICECILDQCEKSKKCMDHCHNTGLFRNILCRSCNSKIG